MLHEFLTEHRDELVNRCRRKAAHRLAPQPTETELVHGIPLFLEQLIATLRVQDGTPRESGSKASDIGDTAGSHGNELLRHGFTVDQAVRNYGDLCQAVTELAGELKAPVTVDEFRLFNRCLDDAIAEAVTEFGRQRERVTLAEVRHSTNERLGTLAHEIRNLLNSACLAFEAIKTGRVAVNGATGGVLDRSLTGLRDLVDRSLAEVRLSEGLPIQNEPVSVRAFLEDIGVSAAMHAREVGKTLAIEPPVDTDVVVYADRHTLASAVSNLIQNALKFSRAKGHVVLAVSATADRVVIEVHDECGGLPAGSMDQLFTPFQQRGADRSGIGLGLSISRRAVEANGGQLTVRNVPGTGCVFSIALPRLDQTLSQTPS
jgi:signal transduction histidine kinase